MSEQLLSPNYIFETSWEVCNKVGGIYTVLSSRAKTLCEQFKNKVIFIGPDVWQGKDNPYFTENKRLLTTWRTAARREGLDVRVGRWNVPGAPLAVLVDFSPFFAEKDEIYAKAWEFFGVDSIKAYGDYDEASMFSYAAGQFVEIVCRNCLQSADSVLYQAHEWMSGLGMLFLKKNVPTVATIFTTHATSIGRSICGNDKALYAYFSGYDGDQMARELNMEAKHSIEKQSAWQADCFTTVSTFTDRECRQLLEKAADVVLPNGFESDFVPKKEIFTSKRRTARKKIFDVVSCLTGSRFGNDTLLISTSGRNDFRCKGFDVYLEALARLNNRMKAQRATPSSVLALIEVPCWTKEPRQDLLERLAIIESYETSLPVPMITHELYNEDSDRILNLIKALGLWNAPGDPVKVILIPCYLEGSDGIFNQPYYDLLTANDLCIYPSYYEPWGYTPLESCAFNIPCITTDLSGFGQWVNAVLGHEGTLLDGVAVLQRNDDNYFETAQAIADILLDFMQLPAEKRHALRRKAAALAAKAEWKHFIGYYYEAYDLALRRTALNS